MVRMVVWSFVSSCRLQVSAVLHGFVPGSVRRLLFVKFGKRLAGPRCHYPRAQQHRLCVAAAPRVRALVWRYACMGFRWDCMDLVGVRNPGIQQASALL